MNYAFSSPLKAVQGSAIKDLTGGRFHLPKSGRSRSPGRRPTSLSSSPSTSSFKPHGIKLSNVLIPTKPKYIPNQRPPPYVHSGLPDGAAEQNERSRKVVITRFLLADGNISFAIGTQIDGVITPDAEEVPVARILDYVSPAELERYENQDFFEEDERERLLPPKKHRGRPRKGDRVVPSFSVAPIGQETSREQSFLSEQVISIKKKTSRPRGSHRKEGGKLTSTESSIQPKVRIGRPIGSHKKQADQFKSTKPSVLSVPSTGFKRGRGRPRLQKNISVVIPSFNGPQPQELESTPSAETESDDMLNNAKPQYSMIAASGLGQSDTEDVTSRDQSVELLPSSKKRRLNTSNAFINLSSDDNDDERSPHPAKRAKTLPETSPDPITDDSTALLRQFQARVYGPSIIPHRHSKPSPTLDDSNALLRQFQTHTYPSNKGSSSSESSMGSTPRPLEPLPAHSHYIPPNSLSTEAPIPAGAQPVADPAKPPASYLNNSLTVSHSPQPQPAKNPISPPKTIQRKVSLTPHFPPSMSFSHKSSNGSAENRPHSSTRPAPSQSSKMTLSQSSRIMPSPLKKKKPPPIPQSAPPQSSQTSSTTNKIGFAGLPRAKDITDYFAPKATVAQTAPIKAPNSPTTQLLDPEVSESEDQLARESSASDSTSSEVIIVGQSRVTPTNQAAAAEAKPQEQSSDHDRTDDESPEDDSSEDESEDEHAGKTIVSDTAAPIQSTANPRTEQSSSEALTKAFEAKGDEEDSSSESDSDSDSESSEVMIIRPQR